MLRDRASGARLSSWPVPAVPSAGARNAPDEELAEPRARNRAGDGGLRSRRAGPRPRAY